MLSQIWSDRRLRMAPRQARRRAVLGALGSGATALTGGCLRRVRSLTGWEPSRQVRLRIKTVPADADPYALEIARTVVEWFTAAGVDAGVVPMTEQELRRQTLLRNEFELFVMRLPPRFRDPDALYTLLHSRFAEDPGWQNPFGYANLDVDDSLDTQRRTAGERRRDVLGQLQLTAARTQPFTLLTVPADIRAVRTATYTDWRSADLGSSLGYLVLERSPGEDGADDGTLRVAVTDRRPTTNLNPLSVEFRRTGILMGLLYDSLGHVIRGRLRPWLAESWEVTDESPPAARLRLRRDTTWHDGEPLTAADVAFTYRLLADTTLGGDGEETVPVPSPRSHGRSSLVDGVEVVDDTTVEIRFADVEPGVALRALTVPILPEHVWQDRTKQASLAGLNVGSITEALVTNNIPPVGSGPLQFLRNTPREEVVLERFDDHFLNRGGLSGGDRPDRVGRVPFETLNVRVVGSDTTAVESVVEGSADVTGTPVGADTVPRIGRSAEAELLVRQSDSPYILGYNTRHKHLGNPRVRHTLARLIDEAYLADRVLGGYGRPAVGPLWDTGWYPGALEWADGNPVTPFLGTDGDVDVQRARAAFREAGYRYNGPKLMGGRT
jgi:peptide/nickel transport system substrate-binding protein